MSVSLDPAVDTLLQGGSIKVLALVKITLPGKTVGYHMGGRPFEYSGLTYMPNRYLNSDGLTSGLGNQIDEITLYFSDVPTSNVDDAIASIEAYDYLNAPVTVSYLAGEPNTDQSIGVLVTNFYEINDVEFIAGAIGDDGQTSLTLEIKLETLARRKRRQTYIVRSASDQKRHNLATDTAFDYVASSPEWVREWGQR
jgi:hypothetical protein